MPENMTPLPDPAPELGACPFCGGKPHHDQFSWSGGHAFCCDGCNTIGPDAETHAEAIAAWNRRVPSDDHARLIAEVERLTRARDEARAGGIEEGWALARERADELLALIEDREHRGIPCPATLVKLEEAERMARKLRDMADVASDEAALGARSDG